jgi:hypothetical protein
MRKAANAGRVQISSQRWLGIRCRPVRGFRQAVLELIVASLALAGAAQAAVIGPAQPQDALDRWYYRDTNVLTKVRFVGGLFIGVGTNGNLVTSPDGTTWTKRSTGTSANLTGAAFAPLFSINSGVFVVVGSGATILTSNDGTNWTQQITTNNCDLTDVAWNSPNFAAGTIRNTDNQPHLLISRNGAAWHSVTLPSTNVSQVSQLPYYVDTVAAGQGTLVVTGGPEFADDIWTSTDALHWQYTGNSDAFSGSATYGNGTFIIVGFEGWPRISTNLGMSWFLSADTNIDNPSGGNLPMVGGDITFGNGTFLIARSFLENGLLLTTNGTSWQRRSTFTNTDLQSVAFGNGTFVAAGQGGRYPPGSAGYPAGIYQSASVATPFITATFLPGSNSIDLRISCEIGQGYRVQTSPDLVNWSNHLSFTSSSPFYEFADPVNPATPSLFYRVVSP